MNISAADRATAEASCAVRAGPRLAGGEALRTELPASEPCDGLGPQRSLADNLSRTAEVAARTYGTWEEATQAVLEILMGFLGMRSVFLTRMDFATQPASLRVVASRNAPGEFAIPIGMETPIQETT